MHSKNNKSETVSKNKSTTKGNGNGKSKRNKASYPQLRPLWLAVFSDIIGFSILITVYPALSLKFGLNPLQNGLIMAVNGFFSFLSAPVWGRLSDKHGRKPMLLISQGGTIAGFLILAFSGNITMVVVSRVVDGLFGGNFPISKAVINDVVEPRDMATELTNVGVAHNVANLFGPALGGVLFVRFGILGPGLVAALTGVSSLAATYFLLDETAPIKVNPDAFEKSVSLETGNLTSTAKKELSVVEGAWHDNRSLVAALGILLLSSLGFMTLVTNFAMFGYLKLDLDAQRMGVFLAMAGLVQIVIRYTLYVPALRKYGDYALVVVGFILYIMAYPWIGFVQGQFQLLFLMLVNSFATSATRGGISAFISKLARPHERGKVQGISSSLDTFAQILGPIMGGLLLTYLPIKYFGMIPFSFMVFSFVLLIFAKKMKKAVTTPQTKMENTFEKISNSKAS